MRSSRLRLLVLSTACLAAAAAIAQPAPAPARVRGEIESVTGSDIKLKTREGRETTLRLADNARVVAVLRASMSDVKAGSYVGIAAMPRPDGSQMALEVVVFPEAMRGAGEGHRPWDLLPESTMTNATVAATVAKSDGQTLSLNYKDGDKTIVVPAEAPVVTLAPAARADVKPGVKVVATVGPESGGMPSVTSIVVGRDGVDPPM